MAPPKGANLEEVVREYFFRNGYVAIRGVPVRFENEDVTDADVWVYGRQGAGIRTRSMVDVKDKRSPKAFERIMWVRGMQLALGCDQAIVATTDNSPKTARFARKHNVTVLSASFLRQWQTSNDPPMRLTSEEFTSCIKSYTAHKQDGDWVKRLEDSKSAIVSLPAFPAFNAAITNFAFFGERAEIRPQHREQAIRATFLAAAYAALALDSALAGLTFETPQARYKQLINGITYGETGDGRVKDSIEKVLSVIESGVNNGRVIARQTKDAMNEMFSGLRAEIIAEFYSKENNATSLYKVVRELEARAHMLDREEMMSLSVEAKSTLGVFADFASLKRSALFNSNFLASKPNVEAANSPSKNDKSENKPENSEKLL